MILCIDYWSVSRPLRVKYLEVIVLELAHLALLAALLHAGISHHLARKFLGAALKLVAHRDFAGTAGGVVVVEVGGATGGTELVALHRTAAGNARVEVVGPARGAERRVVHAGVHAGIHVGVLAIAHRRAVHVVGAHVAVLAVSASVRRRIELS